MGREEGVAEAGYIYNRVVGWEGSSKVRGEDQGPPVPPRSLTNDLLITLTTRYLIDCNMLRNLLILPRKVFYR